MSPSVRPFGLSSPYSTKPARFAGLSSDGRRRKKNVHDTFFFFFYSLPFFGSFSLQGSRREGGDGGGGSDGDEEEGTIDRIVSGAAVAKGKKNKKDPRLSKAGKK